MLLRRINSYKGCLKRQPFLLGKPLLSDAQVSVWASTASSRKANLPYAALTNRKSLHNTRFSYFLVTQKLGFEIPLYRPQSQTCFYIRQNIYMP